MSSVLVACIGGCGSKPDSGTEGVGTTGDATDATRAGGTQGGSDGTITGGLSTTGGSPTTEAGPTTDGTGTDSGVPPGPEEACAAWCAYNGMCSDIPAEYCAMTCAQDFEEGVRPGACQDAYVAFYLCVGGVSSCDEQDLERTCAEQMNAIDASCGG